MSLQFLLSSSRTTRRGLIGLSTVMAALLGLAVSSQGVFVLGLLMAMFGAVLIMIQPILGVYLIAATIPLTNLAIVSSGLTATRVLGMGVFGTWAARKMLLRESWKPVLSTGLFKVTICLVAFALVSGLWANYKSTVYSGVFQLLNLLLWSLLIIDLIDSWDRVDTLVKVLVSAALITSILTIEQFFGEGAKRAGDGISGGVNTTAELLVTLLPFAFYLMYISDTRVWHLLGMSTVLFTIAAVVVTFSRMSFMLLSLAMVVQYWETIRKRTGWIWLVFLTIVIIIMAVTVIPQSNLNERLQTRAQSIEPYLQSAFADGDEETISSRGYHMQVGLAIFEDYPLLGAGYGNYGYRFIYDYQFRVPGGHKVWTKPRSPHSTYIGILADLGLIGLALWLGVIGVVFLNLARARSILTGARSSKQFLLVQAVTYSLLVQSAYGWASNVHKDKLYWLILGLSVAIGRLADKSDRSDQSYRSPVKTRNHLIRS